jgi:acetyl-CoA C-acetyltransferase
VEQVVFGNVIHTSPEDHYLARVVGINAGIPKESPAMTVNRLCGSGPQAVASAAQIIHPFHKIHMEVTAENLAKSHGISREDQDAFAPESHRRALAAIEAGRFEEEIVPVEVKTRKGTVEFKVDEHARPDVSLDALAKLKPAFDRDGTVTAAAAAVVVMSAERAERLGAPVRGRILSYAVCGVEPRTMGIGPVPAVRKALERAGKNLEEVDVVELNEAFAAQSLAVLQDLGLDATRVNPNGGAIGLGHPVAATGAILLTKILNEMERKDHKLGLVSLCIGGGQGIAMLIERD